MTELPPSVDAVTAQLLRLLDAGLPGQLEAFYLVGSVALGDYHEGTSDIDFVAVLAGDHDAEALAAIHAELARDHPEVDCDGIYLRPGDLAAAPAGHGIEARGGQINPHSATERHPVTWLTLADAGIPLRGPLPAHDWIAADRDAAIAYSRANLRSYWRPWLAARRTLLSPDGLALLGAEAITWGCLGIARLHATIATGRVASKSGAGRHALAAFPDHAPIIGECLRLRGHPVQAAGRLSPPARRRAAIAFMDAVLQSAGTD